MYQLNPPRLRAKTVIVLGAGASCDVGYPTNAELVDNICLKFKPPNGHYETTVKGNLFGPTQVESFVRDLEHAQYESIDKFLSERPEYSALGRYAIASEIISWENEDALMQRGKKSWYLKLRGFLGNTPSDHPLKIITFNYDRSLEHYLFRAIKASTNKPDGEILAEISRLRILHVHGHVGALPWQNSSGRFYSGKVESREIFDSSKQVLLSHEKVDRRDETDPAHLIDEADRVYFFGFGFHEENLLKLGIPQSMTRTQKFFGASAKGMPDEDRAALKSRYFNLPLFETIDEGLDHLIKHGTKDTSVPQRIPQVIR
jgi:hypothetical protein